METWQLKQRQSLPLEAKISLSKQRIREWYDHWEGAVYISFSGGKDSTVLLDLVRGIYPEVPAVFCDTGLEYPEIREFVKSFENVTWLKPSMPFTKVIEKYGYPVVSKDIAQKIHEIRTTKSKKLLNKRLYGDEKGYGKISEKWKFLIEAPFKISDRCCYMMKRGPFERYEKEKNERGYLGTSASESSQRLTSYLHYGCNALTMKRPVSRPIMFWRSSDIWSYLSKMDLDYANIYKNPKFKSVDRTGCMFCLFGIHLESGENRLQLMKKTHPKQYKYCIENLGLGEVLDYMNIPY